MPEPPFDDEEPDTPTVRTSGTLEIWKQSVTEALADLDVFGRRDDRDTELHVEGENLLRILASWNQTEPQGEERARIVTRIMDHFRAVKEYTAAVRGARR